ncbi:acyl-CoA synthetase [Halieaceae bacterium IMCC14734]|uniref:Acyl-CoA synthetase n=1 Tax=Candidatus Litorirhabdus singularis TaxID=2518993 RepID=A0ABT3TI56_9GAMM|nr:acyl-CoA synthetase [Candidatus Litorirhabdus singularis]MCX2982013.1 acyl-CoA synthetase [Candidatus Litorirhabdus singularis]
MSTTARSFNLADLFESVASAVPARTAIVSEERRLTYQQLDERATRLASCWQAQGIGRNDHIGLQLRNGSEYMECMLAAYKLRAVPININFHYVEGELAYLYQDADMVALVTHQSFAARVAQVTPDIEALRLVYVVADGSGKEGNADYLDYESALAGGAADRTFPPRDSDDIYIVYTGGTTGMPKGVMWHHRDIFFAAMGGGDVQQTEGPITAPEQLVERIGDEPLVILPTPPFMHAAAQWSAFTALLSGGKIVIPSRGKFIAEDIWQAVNDEGVSMMVIVGDAMANPLIDCLAVHPERWDTSALLVVASGGALFSPATKERLLALTPGTMILDGLGSSETGLMGSKVSARGAPDDDEPRFMVNPHMTVLDEDNQSISPGSGKMGYLARKGHVPIGYYNAPEKSAATFVVVDGERWAIPGDLATVLADGSIFLHGRGSVSINTGGEKVFPEEVESRVKEHDDILDVVVVGLDDERYGEKVVVVCQTRSGEAMSLEHLREFCRSRLANYKMPREVVCLAAIKRSPAGKADYPWAKQAALEALE